MPQVKPADYAKVASRLEEMHDCSITIAALREAVGYMPKLQAVKFLRASGLCESLGEALAAYTIINGEG